MRIAIFIFLVMMSSARMAQAQDQTIRHLVQPLETFYSLSVKYHVTIDEIKAVNPGVTMPKAGEYLNIPVRSSEEPPDKGKECGKLKKNHNQVYEIALMVPLYLEQTLDSAWSESLDPHAFNEIVPFRFLQFYHGFMLAADSMRRQGMNLKVRVYDVDHQASKLENALADPELKKADLIVGPFLKNSFSQVAEFAGTNQIPIVNPLSSRQDILTGNPYVFKILPSPESQAQTLAKLIKRDFSEHNVIIYTANKFQDTEIIADIKQAVENSLSAGAPPVKMVDYASDSIRGFLEFASMTRPNLIIVYAENEALPAALLSKLNAVKSEYPVTVIGMPEWDKFNNLESGYLLNLNAHLFYSTYVDYEDEDVKAFLRRYRADYLDEPQLYAITGFAAGYYFLQALYEYGEDFIDCLAHLRIPMMQNQFQFLKKDGGGYDNIYWNIMQYYDYRLVNRSVSWK